LKNEAEPGYPGLQKDLKDIKESDSSGSFILDDLLIRKTLS